MTARNYDRRYNNSADHGFEIMTIRILTQCDSIVPIFCGFIVFVSLEEKSGDTMSIIMGHIYSSANLQPKVLQQLSSRNFKQQTAAVPWN